jgi:phage gpG-like protein
MDYKKFAEKLRVTEQEIKDLEKKIVLDTEKIAHRYSMEAFKKAQWDNQAWEKRKAGSLTKYDRRNRDKPRALLVKSGNLRRSVSTQSSGNKVIISSDMPYSQIQNEGGTIDHPGGTPYIITEDKKAKFISQRKAEKLRGRNQVVKVTKPHKIKVPKRQFIGVSRELQTQIEAMIDKQLKKLFT